MIWWAPTARLGRYELITRIGQGGMAEVQLALQRGPAGFEKLVVVKLVHGELATQKAFVDMLLDEARVAALVKHPNVVDIYDLGEADGKYFIAMEYLEGEPLLSVLRAGREGKRLDPLSTGRLIADTAEGLEAAHELRSMAGERIELVHHDISLGNIVVLYNGSVKLVDFGVAKATQKVAGPRHKVQGKFSYMAPEKLKGSPGDRRSDIFSLGCVMWEALTLKRLFRGGNDADTMKQVLEFTIQAPSKVNPDVPPEFDAIVMRTLDRDPAKRPPTAKKLAIELEELLLKRGYGAKNDRIAAYMQDTFKDHIAARQKLVQEVVSKGSASDETVDAAFSRGLQVASGSPRTPAPGDFSVVAPLHLLSTPTPFPGASDTATKPAELAPQIFDAVTEVAPPPIVEPDLGLGHEHAPASRIVAAMDWVEELASDPRRRRRALAIATGSLVLVLVVIVAKCSGGGAAPARGGSAVAELAVPAPAVAPEPIAVDAAPVVAAVAPADAALDDPADAAAVDAGASPPHHATEHIPDRHVAARPAPNANALFQKAFQAFVKGETRTALALLKAAKAANPNHAATWRLLGQIYKKQGDHAQARLAFARYLALAPGASDAAAVRKEME